MSANRGEAYAARLALVREDAASARSGEGRPRPSIVGAALTAIALGALVLATLLRLFT